VSRAASSNVTPLDSRTFRSEGPTLTVVRCKEPPGRVAAS
jgi:hypothetical protein